MCLGFYILIGITLFLILPSYLVVLSEQGVTHKYILLGLINLSFKTVEERKWNQISLGYMNVGFVKGVSLNYEQDGKVRHILLNLFFTNKSKAIEYSLKYIPRSRISDETKKKLGLT